MLLVNEIYKSIQGESSLAGVPCVLIRLTGCNLRCNYCDTHYAYEEGDSMTMEQVLSMVKRMKCRFVEITGGEPLLQENVYPLIEKLLAEGYSVLVETNGSVNLQKISSLRNGKDLRIILDIKTPDSGMADKMKWENLNLIQDRDETKFVICGREDYDWARDVVLRYHLDQNKKNEALFSPVHGKLDPAMLSNWILEDGLEVRLNLQLHKLMWGDVRGV